MTSSESFNVVDFINQILSNKNDRGELVNEKGNPQHIYVDLDDVVPFLLYFDQSEFVKEQILLSRDHVKNGFIDYDGYIYSWRMDEYMGGVNSYLTENPDDVEVGKIFQNQLNFLSNFQELGYIPTYYDIDRNIFSKTIASMGYQLVEVVLESNLIKNNIKDQFLKLLRKFIQHNNYFNKNGLFLNKYLKYGITFNPKQRIFGSEIKEKSSIKDSTYLPGTKSSRTRLLKFLQASIPLSRVQFMKNNTNLAFAIIEAYKYSKDRFYKSVLEKWIDGVMGNLYDRRGFVYKLLDGKRKYAPGLSQSFTFIDILCDAYFFVDNNPIYLQIAEDICNFWLSKKMENGLIPRSPFCNWDNVDEQTDFSVSLEKIAELTGKENYKNEGKTLFDEIQKHHLINNTLVKSIYSNDEILEGNVIIRYHTLFLKSYIIYREGKAIYSDPLIHNLIKDR